MNKETLGYVYDLLRIWTSYVRFKYGIVNSFRCFMIYGYIATNLIDM